MEFNITTKIDILILSFLVITLVLSLLRKNQKILLRTLFTFFLFFLILNFKYKSTFLNFLYYVAVSLSLIPLYMNARELEILFRKKEKDELILKFERLIFKKEPSIYFAQKIKNPLLIEILAFGYFSFFLQFLVFGLLFYFKDKELLSLCLLTNLKVFIIGFIISFFFSVKGPRYVLREKLEKKNIKFSKDVPVFKGYFFTKIIIFIIKKFGKEGGGMPSIHAASNLVFVFYIFQYNTLLSIIWAIVTLLLFISCLKFQFHYITDILFGIILAVLVLIIS